MNNQATTPEQLQEARSLIASSGLPMPPVPKDIAEKLFRPDDAHYFTSRDDTPGPWSLGWFLEEVEFGNPENYVMVGLDGHGTESTAAHYYLVEKDIAVFHQCHLSSPYTPEWEDTLSDQYDLIAIMTMAISQSKAKGLLPEESRLVIVRPSYRPPFWGIQPAPGKPVNWQQSGDALVEASSWLAERMH